MAGKIKQMIDTILDKRSKGNPLLLKTTRIKLILKGINPDKYTFKSDDDPVVIEKLEKLMEDLI